jgi:hypothetical protein
MIVFIIVPRLIRLRLARRICGFIVQGEAAHAALRATCRNEEFVESAGVEWCYFF